MEFCLPGRKKVAFRGDSTVLYSNAYRWIHEREVIPVRYISQGSPRGYLCEGLRTKFVNNEREK